MGLFSKLGAKIKGAAKSVTRFAKNNIGSIGAIAGGAVSTFVPGGGLITKGVGLLSKVNSARMPPQAQRAAQHAAQAPMIGAPVSNWGLSKPVENRQPIDKTPAQAQNNNGLVKLAAVVAGAFMIFRK